MSQRILALQSNDARADRRYHGLRISYQSVGVLVGVADVLAIVLSSMIGEAIFGDVSGRFTMPLDVTAGIGMIASLLYVIVAKSAGLYRLPALIKPGRYLKRIFIVCSFVVLALTACLFLLKVGKEFSRGTWLCFAPLMLLSCCTVRMGAANAVKAMLDRKAVVGRRAFLIGEAEELKQVGATYLLHRFGLSEVGRLALDPPKDGSPEMDPKRIAEALDLARLSKAKEFIVVAKWDSAERLDAIEEELRVSPLPVRLLPNHVFRSVVNRHGSHEDCALHLIDLQRSPMNVGELITKRVVDIVCAAFAIVLLLPILLITAVAIKLDSAGPIIFRQRRNGFNQDQFVIYKFRTMTVQEDDESVVQARRGDKRVTRVGKFLRRTSIDELPQLFNVLKGDMALVGPRPHALAHDREYSALIGDYYRRHHVKPGITGWAQVHGFRGETARTEQMRRRVDLDIWYINNWSILVDIRILARTCFALVSHDAY